MPIVLRSPLDGSSLTSSDVLFKYDATFANPHKKVKLVVDGLVYDVPQDEIGCASGKCEFTGNLSDGDHVVYLTRTTNTSGSITITVDAGGSGVGDSVAIVEQLELLNQQQLIVEQQFDFISTAILAGLFMFSAFHGYRTGITR